MNSPRITYKPVGESQSYLFCVEEGEAIASRLILTVVYNDNANYFEHPYAVIENVKTFEQYRRKGYAKRLMAEAIEFARAQGCYKIEVTTSSSKEYVHQMYRNLGFDGEHKTCYWMALDKPLSVDYNDDDI